MEKEALKRIFEFLEEKEKHKVPFIIKVKCEIPFTKEELNIKGRLNLFDSKITSLPEGLKVGGYLSLIGTNMTTLPKGLEVGDFIFIRNTPLTKYTDEKLREMIKPGFIKGKISR